MFFRLYTIVMSLLVVGISNAELPVYEDLESLPLLVLAPQHFVSAPDKNGNSKGMEFSSALQFGPHLLVSDDESKAIKHPFLEGIDDEGFCLFELVPNPATGQFFVRRPWREAFLNIPMVDGDFDDIEGTTARGNTMYMLGSHSYNMKGNRRHNREVIMRLRADMTGRAHVDFKETGIRDRIVDIIVGLPGMTMGRDEVAAELNIEGLSIDPNSNDLLIGIKRPLIGPQELALIMRIENPDDYFEGKNSQLSVRNELLLDAQSSGISSMEWDPMLKGYIIATSFKEKTNDFAGSAIWLWGGQGEVPKEICRFRQLALEGVCRIQSGPLAGNIMLAFDQETYTQDWRVRDGGSVAFVAWGKR